jgi:hypothetical protein
VSALTLRRSLFTTSARAPDPSSRAPHGERPTIVVMDIVAVLLGIASFAILIALVAGIDRI